MRYRVRACIAGVVDTVEIDALDEADVHRQVAARAGVALRVTPARASLHAAARSRFDSALFATELAELLDAGLEIAEALEALAEASRDAAATRVCVRLLESLRAGASFSQALAAMPEHFPALFVGLVRASEHSSGVLSALRRWGEYRQRHDALRTRIGSALVYPALLLVVGACVTLFLVGYVVPRFAVAYRGTTANLPWLSREMMAAGETLAAHRPGFATGLALALLLVVQAVRRAARSGRLESALARLPGVGARVTQFRLSQLHLTLGTLLQAGLPALGALELACSVVPPVQQPALAATMRALQQGERWSDALAAQGLVTPISRRLLRAGEGTGRLADMLVRSARHQDGELARWLERFSRLFEPLLMVAIGLVVGAIVVLLYLPIFDLAGSLQ